jgi:hypothetical protein
VEKISNNIVKELSIIDRDAATVGKNGNISSKDKEGFSDDLQGKNLQGWGKKTTALEEVKGDSGQLKWAPKEATGSSPILGPPLKISPCGELTHQKVSTVNPSPVPHTIIDVSHEGSVTAQTALATNPRETKVAQTVTAAGHVHRTEIE